MVSFSSWQPRGRGRAASSCLVQFDLTGLSLLRFRQSDLKEPVLVGCLHLIGVHGCWQRHCTLEPAEEPFGAVTLIFRFFPFTLTGDRQSAVVQRDLDLFFFHAWNLGDHGKFFL